MTTPCADVWLKRALAHIPFIGGGKILSEAHAEECFNFLT
jgi:hypothetical protein